MVTVEIGKMISANLSFTKKKKLYASTHSFSYRKESLSPKKVHNIVCTVCIQLSTNFFIFIFQNPGIFIFLFIWIPRR